MNTLDKLDNLALFWRDAQAQCLTSFHFSPQGQSPQKRALIIAATLQKLTTLQIYAVILNRESLKFDLLKSLPTTGTQYRFEAALLPTSPLNPRAGINPIKLTIPGPIANLTQMFATTPVSLAHPCWQPLEIEVIPYLRLPNGLSVQAVHTANYLHRATLLELPEERRPQPGRSPVDAPLAVITERLVQARSQLSRAQRNIQPTEVIITSVEKYQDQLSLYQTLHLLEQQIIRNIAPLTPDSPQLDPLNTAPPNNYYLPLIPEPHTPEAQEWQNVLKTDFYNLATWLGAEQLKIALQINSERAFWRTIKTLKHYGLRTRPAKQDARIKLFYRPDLKPALAKWKQAQAPKPTPELCKEPLPQIATQDLAPLPVEDSLPSPSILAILTQLQHQQQVLEQQQQLFTTSLAKMEHKMEQAVEELTNLVKSLIK